MSVVLACSRWSWCACTGPGPRLLPLPRAQGLEPPSRKPAPKVVPQ